jgi:hypothetical protein
MTMTRREWKKAWPNYCRNCEANTDSANPCQSCLGSLLCPRCGRLCNEDGEDAIDPEDASIPCRNCGWVEHAEMGCPPSQAQIREEKRIARETEKRYLRHQISTAQARLSKLED